MKEPLPAATPGSEDLSLTDDAYQDRLSEQTHDDK